MQKQLNISSRAFWDVDFDKLLGETEKYAAFIIRKVFEHGTFNDVLSVIKHYGKKQVVETMINTNFLSERCLHFASTVLNVEKTKFKCFTNKQQQHFYTKRSKI